MEERITDELRRLVKDYQTPEAVKQTIRRTKIMWFVGAAGAGKNTVINELVKTGRYHFVVSQTTRQPRRNLGVMERDGVEYHFVEIEEMRDLLKNGRMVEAKVLHDSYVSGTSVSELEQAQKDGRTAVNDVDVQGVEEYKKISPAVVPVFLLPPSHQVWMERLHQRYVDWRAHEAEIAQRKRTALKELRQALADGYFEFVINDRLADTVTEVESLNRGEEREAAQAKGEALAKRLLAELETETEAASA